MADEKKVSIKMVSGERYACPVMGDDIITVGKIVKVTQPVADALLADEWADIAGNMHPYFEEVDDDAVEGVPTKAARSRTKTAPAA